MLFFMENQKDKKQEEEDDEFWYCGTPFFSDFSRKIENLRNAGLPKWKYYWEVLKLLRKLI